MRRLLALLWLALALPATAADAPADPRQAGPLQLILTYHVRPADRPALRQAMQAQGLAQLDRLKAEAGLAEYHVLIGRYADAQGWDMALLLRFENPAALAKWRQVEETSPGGLPPEAAKLVTAIDTTPADLMRGRRVGDAKAPRSVWLIVPYDYLVGLTDYLAYVDGYLIPQVSGWFDEGVLSGYGFYVARYGAGRAWSAMVAYEYRGEEGLAARDATVAKIRARLAADPNWKRFADGKQDIRKEKVPVVADELVR